METLPRAWTGADIVFFDCDSTLSSIEGIDELALRRGVDIAHLTADAMAGRISLDEIYGERLARIAPTRDDFSWLVERYRETAVPGARETVAALTRLGIDCHVLSGGLAPAVLPFAIELGFAAEQVHAVPYPLDEPDPAASASAHPLARNGGKPGIIAQICADGPAAERRMIVGDGASDLEAAREIGLFVGFGGVVCREKVRDEADVFVEAPGLWSVAVLAAGPERAGQLPPLIRHQSLIDLPTLSTW